MAKKRIRRGKETYFPRVKTLTLDYPGGRVIIQKNRRGMHRVIAGPEVTITETRVEKP